MVFVFNFNKYDTEMAHFHHGRYSCFSPEWKEKIFNHYKANLASQKYIDSYLNPDQYFEKYATLLNVSEESLRSVGELCNPVDSAKETLDLKEKNTTAVANELMLF